MALLSGAFDKIRCFDRVTSLEVIDKNITEHFYS